MVNKMKTNLGARVALAGFLCIGMVLGALVQPVGAAVSADAEGWVVSSSRTLNTATATIATDVTPDVADVSGVAVAGRGATFQGPFMSIAAPDYSATHDDSSTYGRCGSSCGKRGLFGTPKDSDFTTLAKPGRIDGPNPGGIVMSPWLLFALSDAPLSASDEAKAATYGSRVLTFPTILSGVTVSFNVPGKGSGDIDLTPEQISAAYRGEITNWNQIVAGVDLPLLAVHRCDGSGTSYAFTDFLARSTNDGWIAHEEFHDANPALAAAHSGDCGDGNLGVSKKVIDTPGALGYVEIGNANGIGNPFGTNTYARVVNAAGNAILPTDSTIAAAADAMNPTLPKPWESWQDVSIVWAPGGDSYPIASFSYALLWENPAAVVHPGGTSYFPSPTPFSSVWTPAHWAVTEDFLREVLTTYQADIPSTGAVPLGPAVRALSLSALDAASWGPRVTVSFPNVLETGFPLEGQTVAVDTAMGAFDVLVGEYADVVGPVTALDEGRFVRVGANVLTSSSGLAGYEVAVLDDGSLAYRSPAGYASAIAGPTVQGQVIDGMILVRA